MSPSLRPTSSRRVTDMTRRAASLALCVLPCRRCQGSSRSRQHSVLQSARVRRVALLFRSRHRTSLSGLRRHGHHPDGPGLRFVPTGPDMITPRVNMASVELGEAVAISGRLARGVVDAFERLRRSPRTLTAPFGSRSPPVTDRRVGVRLGARSGGGDWSLKIYRQLRRTSASESHFLFREGGPWGQPVFVEACERSKPGASRGIPTRSWHNHGTAR
jgi:hypothetical protein